MKFVVYGPDFEATSRLLEDIKGQHNVFYYDNPLKFKSKFLERVMAANLERYTWFPLKWLWKYLIKYGDIGDDEKAIFIYWQPWQQRLLKMGFIDYIKRKKKKTYHIARYADIHSARVNYTPALKECIDDAYLFDKDEADRLGMKHFRLNYSKINVKENESIPYSDLFFVGQAKDRYTKLIEVFEWCKRNGITTNFCILGVPEEERLYPEEIQYRDTIPYEETLQIAMRSKCSLEVQLSDVGSYSNRVYEALVNGKKVLTNNKSLINEDFYDSQTIFIYDNLDDLDPLFLKQATDYDNTGYAEQFSPKRFLEHLEKSIIQ